MLKKKYKYKTKKFNEKKSELCNQLRRIKKDFIYFRDQKKSKNIYHDWIYLEITRILPDKDFGENSIAYDLVCNPQEYLPCMIYMMQKIETDNIKINNVFPTRSDIIPKHILIDTVTLVNLFIDAKKYGKVETFTKNGNLVKKQDEIWNYFFRTERKIFHLNNNTENGYKFNYMINTDGVSCSILLLKNKVIKKKGIKISKKEKKQVKEINKEKYINELEDEEYNKIKNKKIVAIDPNHSDLIHCINEDNQMFRYTQDQRRKELKIKKQRNFLEKEKKKIVINDETVIDIETNLSKYNRKTLIFNNYKSYIEVKNETNTKLEEFYTKYIFRKQKLNSYISCKRSETRMIRNFEKIFGNPENVIIGFGDYEQYKQRKYKEPVKGKGFRTLFRKAGYKVYLVDEHKTSARCSSCDGICSTFRYCNNPRPWKTNIVLRHGLVKCKTCSGLWNRDTNAARNIYKITENEILRKGRPEYLKRTNRTLSGTTSVSELVIPNLK